MTDDSLALSPSYWTDSAAMPTYPPLDHDDEADVIIIGGGITGLTAAYLLADAGRSVVLLERRRCAAIDTGHTTAHLTMVTDTRLADLTDRLGRSHAQAVWDSGLAAIAQIDMIARAHRIGCHFGWVDGYLHARPHETSRDDVEALREEAALAADMGFDAEFVNETPLVGTPGVRLRGQARVHPRHYLAGVANAVTALGGRIYELSEVDGFQTRPLSVSANGRTVRGGDLVIATHNPLAGIRSMLGATLFQTKLALYTSYAIAGRVEKGRVPDALWWDTANPYRYLRIEPHAEDDLVIFGGEDHKTGQTADPGASYDRLEEALTALVPGLSLTHRWSGQVIETPDGLPFIGRMTEHQYAATGFAGNGMTFGTLGGMLAADAILGRANPWADLYDPDRPAVRRGLWDYVTENADYPYYLLRSRFAGADSRPWRAIPRNEGAVIDHRGQRLAVFRQEDGSASIRSATCTHLGCIVSWNGAERTWDCPCHGSRFSTMGEVLSGPAQSPLGRIDVR